MANIFDAYTGSIPTEESYYQQDPYYMGGASLSKMQLQPRNNTEAILLPLLQGLGSGVLGGMGASNAREKMYDDLKSNPLLQAYTQELGSNVGPVASGGAYDALLNNYAAHDYTQADMPEGWTGKTAKSDLIMASIMQQAQQEEEQKKQASQDALTNQIAAQNNQFDNQVKLQNLQNGVDGTSLGGMGGLPKSLRDDAIKETGQKSKIQESLSQIDDNYEKMAKISGNRFTGESAYSSIPFIGSKLPTPTLDELKRLTNASVREIDNASGRETNSDLRQELVAQFTPNPAIDSLETMAKKRDELKAMVLNASKGTPILDALSSEGEGRTKGGDGNQQKQSGGISREAAIAELKRRGKR